MTTRSIRLLIAAGLCAWLVACGGGGGGGAPDRPLGLLAGDAASPALSALVNLAPQPAASADIVNGLMLTRLQVAIAAGATVGEVNSALAAVGARIVAMVAGLPAVSVAIPRQNGLDELKVLASTLQAQPGILAVLLAWQAGLDVAPPAPADAVAAIGHLQSAKFPAAWNARSAAGDCTDKVRVIVADMFHRPVVLDNGFATQVPGVTELGVDSVDPLSTDGFHGYDVLTTLAAKLDTAVPTGANPFVECLDIKALQLVELNQIEIVAAINDALLGNAGKVIVNASYGFFDACSDPATEDEAACSPQTLRAVSAYDRAVAAAWQRKQMSLDADTVLVTSAAGNDAVLTVAAAYRGTGLAKFNSAMNIAATADPQMTFITDPTLWQPICPPSVSPCLLPDLSATPEQVGLLATLLAQLQQTAPATNVIIVGSSDNVINNPSMFSEAGADVQAVGEQVPTLSFSAPETTGGTSFAAPQVAGLASYLWMLSPELRALPVSTTIAAIKANASSFPAGLIDAYATVLSLDQPVPVTPATARVRLAILDIDGDGDFDLADLQAFHGAYVDSGLVLEPSVQDFSRFDLNGDGFTGGGRTTRMDLDPTGSTRFGAPVLSEVFAEVGGVEVTFNEREITDAHAMCYYANSALYSGADLAARDALIGELCGDEPAAACPTYAVDVGGRIGNSPSRVFNVNAEAGFSVPGAYGGASLGGNLTLSLTSGYAGTALATGDVTYLVEVDSPGAPIESIWRWSVRSNVNVGGSCQATLSIGGAARTITATNNDLQVLEIPVSVRHGDVLKATLDAVCTSPGLLPGPPEILVNANIGSTIDILGIPGGRFRAVMCIP
jgi:hypothetical protein